MHFVDDGGARSWGYLGYCPAHRKPVFQIGCVSSKTIAELPLLPECFDLAHGQVQFGDVFSAMLCRNLMASGIPRVSPAVAHEMLAQVA